MTRSRCDIYYQYSNYRNSAEAVKFQNGQSQACDVPRWPKRGDMVSCTN